MIAFSCPKCEHQLTRHDNEAGSKIPCPSCGQRLQVPQRRAEKTSAGELILPEAANLAPPVKLSSAPAPSATDKSPGALRCVCPQCQAVIKADPRRAGSIANCPRCATPFEIPVPRTADLLIDAADAPATAIKASASAATTPDPLTWDSAHAKPLTQPPTIQARPSPLRRILLIGGLLLTLLLGTCGGFAWMAFRSERESQISYLKNQIASSEAKLNALEIELNGVLAQLDRLGYPQHALRAAGIYDSQAFEAEQVAKCCDQLAVYLPAGTERDDYIRIAQDRRTRAQNCRNNAAAFRGSRP